MHVMLYALQDLGTDVMLKELSVDISPKMSTCVEVLIPFISPGCFQVTLTCGLPVKLQLRTVACESDTSTDEAKSTPLTLGKSTIEVIR